MITKGKYATPEDREKENLRVRAKFALRAHRRKVDLYFKALDIVRQREECKDKLVNLRIQYPSHYGERIAVVGDINLLGNWVATNAVPMMWNPDNIWTTTLTIPPVVNTFHYKYILISDDHGVTWEWGNNHRLEISDDDKPIVVTDEWGAGTSPA